MRLDKWQKFLNFNITFNMFIDFFLGHLKKMVFGGLRLIDPGLSRHLPEEKKDSKTISYF